MDIEALYNSKNIAKDLKEDKLTGIGNKCLQDLHQDLIICGTQTLNQN